MSELVKRMLAGMYVDPNSVQMQNTINDYARALDYGTIQRPGTFSPTGGRLGIGDKEQALWDAVMGLSGGIRKGPFTGPTMARISEVANWNPNRNTDKLYKELVRENLVTPEHVSKADLWEVFSSIVEKRKLRSQNKKLDPLILNQGMRPENAKRATRLKPFKNDMSGGLWSKKMAEDVRSSSWDPIFMERAVNRANMEAVQRILKKQGWKVRHASTGRDGRKSSRYLQAPDGKFEVRISDHQLPQNPRRDYLQSNFGTRWDEEIVLRGRENPQGIIDEIIRLYSGR